MAAITDLSKPSRFLRRRSPLSSYPLCASFPLSRTIPEEGGLMDLTHSPLRAPGDGGPGFCYDSDRDLFRGAGDLLDGPLLVALDSNIIFDLEKHGPAILEQETPPAIDPRLGHELLALGHIIDLWMMRDIRFIVVPRTREDFRRPPSADRMSERERTFQQIEYALTFQVGDWEDSRSRLGDVRPTSPPVDQVIDGVSELDALMLRSAWDAGVDIFLTRDEKVLSACGSAAAPMPLVASPSMLRDRLGRLGDDLVFLGMIEHADCHWSFGFPMGDTGKWVPLFEAMSSEAGKPVREVGVNPCRYAQRHAPARRLHSPG